MPAFAAQPPEATLPPVFVTSTRTETPLEQVTTSATVITAKDIEDQQAETVLEVLRQVPGFDVVQTGSRGTGTSVFIRGSEADQVLVLIDGVEVNSTTTGAFNFAHLTTENIERIEIIRGAGGTLYGSQAIGGVINILTKRGRGPAEFGLSAEGGNGWTNRQTLSLSGEAGQARLLVQRRAHRDRRFPTVSTTIIEIWRHRRAWTTKLPKTLRSKGFFVSTRPMSGYSTATTSCPAGAIPTRARR